MNGIHNLPNCGNPFATRGVIEWYELDTFRTPPLPISAMGHARLYLTLHLRISAKAEGVPTLQQPPFFSKGWTGSVRFGRQKAKVILMCLSYTFLILALSRPQIGTTIEIVKRSGLDIKIGLDISASMLAEDIKPNRLLKAKHAISSFIDRLEGDRVGLIAFAGDSFCPVPIDHRLRSGEDPA